jgi:hypothetical protein
MSLFMMGSSHQSLKFGSSIANTVHKTNAKTWQCKPNDSQRKAEKDVNTFVKKHNNLGIQNEINTIVSMECKGSEDKDLNMLDVDLKNFNYEDMENMKLDSNLEFIDGEIST